MLINRTSLSQTVDAINAAIFSGRTLPAAERGLAARWIAGRQGLPGAYGGTFAGFPSERSSLVLFTGERIASASAQLAASSQDELIFALSAAWVRELPAVEVEVLLTAHDGDEERTVGSYTLVHGGSFHRR